MVRSLTTMRENVKRKHVKCTSAHSLHKKVRGLKSKIYTKKRHAEKASMKKTIAMHQERDNKHKAEDGAKAGAVPAYLLDREQVRTMLQSHSASSSIKSSGCAWPFKMCFWWLTVLSFLL